MGAQTGGGEEGTTKKEKHKKRKIEYKYVVGDKEKPREDDEYREGRKKKPCNSMSNRVSAHTTGLRERGDESAFLQVSSLHLSP
ncbi:hypothetical protein EYF80_011267 [Liparis tanakae]|uniref:Uncharacterized protein n=1 Tax=Liparis tanakae TaxID=230148 RepID=A0A4Z2ILZ1_9TELE|nr:hypothetical protein EYF80_011267 [Liparis tanakae]